MTIFIMIAVQIMATVLVANLFYNLGVKNTKKKENDDVLRSVEAIRDIAKARLSEIERDLEKSESQW